MLNLPGTSTGAPHPVVQALETLYQQGDTNLMQAVGNLDNFKKYIQRNAFFPRVPEITKDFGFTDFTGGMMRIPKDRAPVMLWKNPVNARDVSREFLQINMAYERGRQLQNFARAGEQGARLVQITFDEIMSNPALLKAARQLDDQIEGAQRGTGLFGTQAGAAVGVPSIEAMHQIQNAVNRIFRNNVGKIFEAADPVYGRLKNPNNKVDRVNVMMFVHASRQGWDQGGAVKLSEELTGVTLANTKRNADRWKKMFGTEFPFDKKNPMNTLLPTPGTEFKNGFFEYKPLAMTPLGLKGGQTITGIDLINIRNKNFLARQMGRYEVRERPGHVPPIRFGGKDRVFLFSESGEFKAIIPGKTHADAVRKAELEVANVNGEAYWLDESHLGRHADLYEDEAFKKMTDFTDPLLQTGPATGKQVGSIPDVGSDAFLDIIKSQQRQFESLKRQTMEVFFAPELQLTRQRMMIASPESVKTGKSVWQLYSREITGVPALHPKEVTGKTYFAIESIYDDMLGVLHDSKVAALLPGVGPAIRTRRGEDKLQVALQSKLGEFNPFNDALEFANRTQQVGIPGSLKQHLAAVNGVTALLTLRLFEIGHSILTLTSLAATMPAVIAGMRMTDAEKALPKAIGREKWLKRVGAYGAPATDDIASWSPTRAIMTGIHFMFSEEGRRVWKLAQRKGYFTQKVAEQISTITAPTEGYWMGLARRKLDIASTVSDKSEEWARGISFMVGYKYHKDVLGLVDDVPLMTAANKFANDTIGDYSPNNRPRIFQGAVGMPLGLFMTFMWNYYQRIFGYIENGQTRALVTQFATQAAVFGGQTVPGFRQYSDMFFSNYDGSVNPVDGIRNRYGEETAEWFLYGSLSNLPKMFGADDGIALYTRGDVNFRNIPSIVTFGDTPVASMVKDFYRASKETFGMVRQRGGFDAAQMSEIVQSYSTNRFFRNFASLFTGHVTDRRGQQLATTPTFADIFKGEIENEIALIARGVGMRTLFESANAEATARNRSIEVSRRYRQDEIRRMIRSEFRKGEPDRDVIMRGITNYLDTGGSPEGIPSWIQEQFLRSGFNKTSLDTVKYFRSGKSNQALRLLNVSSPELQREVPTPIF